MKTSIIVLSSVAFLFIASCGMPISVGIQSEDYGIGGTYSTKGGLQLGVNADAIINRTSGK